MLVKLKKMFFIDGAMVYPFSETNKPYDLPERYKFNPKTMELFDGDDAPTDAKPEPVKDFGPTKKEIMLELDGLGIVYKPIQSKAELLKLLEENKPGWIPRAPSKEADVLEAL